MYILKKFFLCHLERLIQNADRTLIAEVTEKKELVAAGRSAKDFLGRFRFFIFSEPQAVRAAETITAGNRQCGFSINRNSFLLTSSWLAERTFSESRTGGYQPNVTSHSFKTELKMYQNFSDKDLMEAYTTMMDYSNRISPELSQEIEKRHGLEKFKTMLDKASQNKDEADRLFNQIIQLTKKGLTLKEIHDELKSEIWDKNKLEDFINDRHFRHLIFLEDKKVKPVTIKGSIHGLIIGSVVGSFLWCVSMIFLKQIFYPFLIIVYIINYLIIRILTGQTRNNVVVFVSSLLGTIASLIGGFLILKHLFT